MKRLLTVVALLVLLLETSAAQHPNITIRQMQEVPLDSLLLADSLQNNNPARWTLQAAPYYRDTVVITAVCVVPAKIITFTNRGWTMLLADTGANPFFWGSVLVRVAGTADTAQATLDGFLNVERGDVIRMTGRVDEFPAPPTPSMNSLTQFVPITGVSIDIIGSAPVPQFVQKGIPDFYTGLFPGGKIKYSTGEPYEGALVNFTTPFQVPLRVNERLNTGRGTFSIVDSVGNMLSDYDASKYFTLKGTSIDHPYADSIWTVKYPNVGTILDTVRGFITVVSGQENQRGYRVAPIYRRPYPSPPGLQDVVFGIVLPSITTHRRNPIVVPPDSAGRISCRIIRQTGGFPITGNDLLYSLNNGPFTSIAMSYQASDSTYNASIPQQAANTFVHYFIQATDSAGNRVRLASSAFGGSASDTAQGFFFYTVLNRPLTIQDIQYTPYPNGRTSYLGAVVSVSGIVTADTAHIGFLPLNTGGTSAWYMQTGSQPWNGIWFNGPLDTLGPLRNGDSVTVTGSVAENFEVTRIQNITSKTVHATARPEPAFVVSTTGAFGPTVGNGTPAAEQYEGMLVKFNNVTVSSVNPVFSDATEFEVDDGSGPIIVRRDGRHNYSNVPADTVVGRTILKLGDHISYLQGVMYFSFNRYKIDPRTNGDFGVVTSVPDVEHEPGLPKQFTLAQNYPNPFNPTTTIEYSLPTSDVVTLKIYNLLGQEVKTLIHELQSPGTYKVHFDAHSMSTGVYFYSLSAGQFRQVKKLLLIK